MRKLSFFVLLLIVNVFLFADQEEDVRFVAALQRRAMVTRNDDWFKLAREYGIMLLREGKVTGEAKRELCTRLYDILTALVKIATDAGETELAKSYEEDRVWIEKQGVGKLFKLNSIGNRLLLLQGKAEAVALETDKKKREEERSRLREEFEELNKEIEKTIKEWREDVAREFPHSDFWRFLKPKEKQALAEAYWYRDYLEFLYAKSYVFQAKLYEGEERKKRLKKVIKKFLRFTRGYPEFEGDTDPEPREFVPKTELEKAVADAHRKWKEEMERRGEVPEPEPRVLYPLLTHLGYYWMARAYFDLNELDNALRYANYAAQVVHTLKPPIPGVKGSGTSPSDLKTTVEVVLKSKLLIAQVLEKQKKIEEAVEHLYEVLGSSGKLMDPARADEVKYRYPNIYTTEEGLFCAMELGELLVQLKRYAEGMAIVYRIYIQQRRKRSPTGEPHPLEVVAAHRMAKIYDIMSREGNVGTLPVGQMFGVAEGYYSLQQDDKAIRAYKLALCAPGTDEEKNFFLPVALFRLGVVLQHRGRHMEAGIVFLELIKRYKNHPLYGSYIIDAARGAVAAFRKLTDADEFGAELYKLAKEERKKILPPGREDFNERIRIASQHIQKKRFDKAIEALEGITETIEEPIPGKKKKRKILYDKYPLARALLGSAYALKFSYTAEEKPEPKLLDKAAVVLKEALDAIVRSGKKDEIAEAMARRYLGEVYTNPHFYRKERSKWAREAIKILQIFDRRFRDNEDVKRRGYPMYAKAKLIEAYRLVGELDAAERHFEEFARAYSTTKLFQKICMDLFKAYKEEGIHAKEKNPQYAASLFRTAGKMLKEWLISRKREKKGNLTPDDQMWVAQQQAEIGQYKEARKVFSEFLSRLRDVERMDDEEFALFLRAKTGIAQCYAEEGKHRRAAETLDQLRVIAECVNCGYRTYVIDPQKFVDDEQYRQELYNEKNYNICPKEGIYVECSRPECKKKFFISKEDMERLEASYEREKKKKPDNPDVWRLETVDCPECGAALDYRDILKRKCLRRVLDGDFVFQYRVAEHYWNAFKKSEQRDVYLRNRALDILSHLYHPLEFSIKNLSKKKASLEKSVEKDASKENELKATRKALKTLTELHPKVVYMILLIFYNTGNYFEVVQYFEDRNDGPVTTEEQWEKLVPAPFYRPKMKELYQRAKAKVK